MTAVYDPKKALITLNAKGPGSDDFNIYADDNPVYFHFFRDRIKQAAVDEYLAINGGCGSDSPEIIPGKEYEI